MINFEDVSKRLKESRIMLNLTQKDVAERTDVNRDTINNIERNRLKNPQQKIPFFKVYCREFGINYLWLMEGVGDPISEFPKTIIDDLANTYKLSAEAKELIKTFVSLPEDKRKIIIDFFSSIKKDEN